MCKNNVFSFVTELGTFTQELVKLHWFILCTMKTRKLLGQEKSPMHKN